jgi:hypothetical protein
MGLNRRLQQIEHVLRITTVESRATQARRHRGLCPACGGLQVEEVLAATALLPRPFVVRQSGHPEAEEILLDLQRQSARCERCDEPTLGGLLAEVLYPCHTCPPREIPWNLPIRPAALVARLGAIGMLPAWRCPTCGQQPQYASLVHGDR